MFGAIVAPALLLLASAGPSLAQEPTEGILTVQTSVPPAGLPVPTSVCFENCIVEPCSPCASVTSEVQMSIPGGETPEFTSVLPTTTPNIITTPEMSVPEGETPISTGPSSGAPSSGAPTSGAPSSASSGGTPSSSGTAPPEQSTGAASPGLKGDGSSYVFAMALSGMSMMFGAAWFLL